MTDSSIVGFECTALKHEDLSSSACHMTFHIIMQIKKNIWSHDSLGPDTSRLHCPNVVVIF